MSERPRITSGTHLTGDPTTSPSSSISPPLPTPTTKPVPRAHPAGRLQPLFTVNFFVTSFLGFLFFGVLLGICWASVQGLVLIAVESSTVLVVYNYCTVFLAYIIMGVSAVVWWGCSRMLLGKTVTGDGCVTANDLGEEMKSVLEF